MNFQLKDKHIFSGLGLDIPIELSERLIYKLFELICRERKALDGDGNVDMTKISNLVTLLQTESTNYNYVVRIFVRSKHFIKMRDPLLSSTLDMIESLENEVDKRLDQYRNF